MHRDGYKRAAGEENRHQADVGKCPRKGASCQSAAVPYCYGKWASELETKIGRKEWFEPGKWDGDVILIGRAKGKGMTERESGRVGLLERRVLINKITRGAIIITTFQLI